MSTSFHLLLQLPHKRTSLNLLHWEVLELVQNDLPMDNQKSRHLHQDDIKVLRDRHLLLLQLLLIVHVHKCTARKSHCKMHTTSALLEMNVGATTGWRLSCLTISVKDSRLLRASP